MKLFISYSRDDKAWTYELWRNIRDELHHDAWIDKRLVPADDWWGSICDNIETCDVFVYVMSPKSVESIYCTGELDYALALNKPILPLMLKRCDFPESLRRRRVQYQSITDDMSMDKVLNRILMGLMAIQQRDYEPQAAPRPDVPKPTRDPEHIFEVFAIAEEAAAEANITLAQALFAQVIATDPDGLGAAAKERMDEIAIERDRATAYANVKRLAENPVTIKGARAAWRAFQRTYGDYDPDGLANTLAADNAGVVPTPAPATPTPPRRNPTPPDVSAEDILPPPFAWIEIPGGSGTMQATSYLSDVTVQIPAETYWMSEYPVTNAQFAKFVDAGGYRERQWWTDAGWGQREKDGWTEPEYWKESKWNGADYPVVGVSWYEALAFANWLNDTVGAQPWLNDTVGAQSWLDDIVGAQRAAPLHITLPTEAQWQWAAQGSDGREYPWGSTFDKNRCNTEESGIGRTTPVTQYEGKGDSPFAVVDMAGNVYEWCLTNYHTGANDPNAEATRRGLRGGSWLFNHDFARAAARNFSLPNSRNFNYGFRLCRVRAVG